MLFKFESLKHLRERDKRTTPSQNVNKEKNIYLLAFYFKCATDLNLIRADIKLRNDKRKNIQSYFSKWKFTFLAFYSFENKFQYFFLLFDVTA